MYTLLIKSTKSVLLNKDIFILTIKYIKYVYYTKISLKFNSIKLSILIN